MSNTAWLRLRARPLGRVWLLLTQRLIQLIHYFLLGATVAIRYATVRRQGEIGPDGLERQTITYPSVHVRLVPLIARAYVFVELGRALVSIRPSVHVINEGIA
jgi:hypothetical protein